jgi:3-oxoacyl-[acyl-carrier protein] reductase
MSKESPMTKPESLSVNEGARELTGQAAVVTGSSSGIGRAIALELARGGADVLVHSRASRREAEEVAAAITALGRRPHVITCDLADPASHEALVDQAWRWADSLGRGGVGIWINNAGADVLTGDAVNWSFDERLEYLWKVDVSACVRLSRMAGGRMQTGALEDGASVILNMGWSRAFSGMEGDSGQMFAAVKGAVAAFTMSLSRTIAPRVRVNCIAPGWIKTEWGEGASNRWQERAIADSLLARWGTPDDVAQVARFLVSPAASFITAQIIAVDGGQK